MLLARRCVVLCGCASIDLSEMLNGIQVFAAGVFHITPISGQVHDTVVSVFRVYETMVLRDNESKRMYSSLLQNVIKGRSAACSLAHDRIFATLGMAADDALVALNQPDYEMSVEDVYARFLQTWVETYQSLDILMCSGVDSVIASWIPDWRIRTAECNIVNVCLRAKHVFIASARTEPQCLFPRRPLRPDCPRLLEVTGFEFDTIRAVEPEISNQELRERQPYMNTPRSWRLLNRRQMVTNSGANWGVDFWITHSLELSNLYQRLNAEEIADLEKSVHDWLASTTQDTWPSQQFKEVMRNSIDGIFFTTAGGKFGFVPYGYDLEPHDRLCVLLGASLPFIIRPGEKDDPNTPCRLIGPCYIRGVVDGQLMAGLEDGTYQRKVFRLE